MGRTRVGLPGVPDREDPQRAVDESSDRGYDACEIDFEGSFWMDYPWAERFGESGARGGRGAVDPRAALRLHGPPGGERAQVRSAVGALDRSAGIAKACGAEVVVFHPGFLLGRAREDAIARSSSSSATLRERLEGEGAGGPVRHRGDGPRARPRLARRRARDLAARRAGCGRCSTSRTCTRRATAPTRASLFARRARGGGRRPRAGRAVPHPLLRHRVREPKRDEAPSLRRGNAPRRSAAGGARAVRAPGDGDLGVARRGVEPGDQGDPGERPEVSGSGAARRLAEQVAQRLLDLACLVLASRSRRKAARASSGAIR